MVSPIDNYELHMDQLEKAVESGDLTLFLARLRPLFWLLGSDLSIRVAAVQLEDCFSYLDSSSTDPIWKKKLQLWMKGLAKAKSELENEQESGDEYTCFFLALEYLVEGSRSNIEALRIHSAKRAIQFSLYASMTQFDSRNFSGKSSEEVAKSPEHRQFLSLRFRKIVEDIKLLKQL
jgi:hypothetical protein